MRFKYKSKGFSIVEVLVAIALVAMLAFGINHFIMTSFKNIRLLKAEAFVKTFSVNLATYLHSEKACTNTFKQVNPLANGDAIPSIKDGSSGTGITVYALTDSFNEQNNRVTLQSMTISNYVAAAGKANFNLALNYTFNDFTGSVVMLKLISINAEVDASDNVTSCKSFNGVNPDFLFVKVTGDETKTGDLTVSGDLSIGSVSTDQSSVEVISDPAGSPRAMTAGFTSSRSLKENIKSLNTKITGLRQLNAYRFKYKNSKKWNIGFLAQEVEAVAPDAVIENIEGKKLVSYKSLIPHIWEYHKSVYRKHLELLARVKALENGSSK